LAGSGDRSWPRTFKGLLDVEVPEEAVERFQMVGDVAWYLSR
jgi:hypothetical protein